MEYAVTINSVEGNMLNVSVNDVEYEVEAEGVKVNPTRMSTQKRPEELHSEVPEVKKAEVSGDEYPIESPLPGVILEIKVKEGDAVKAGQALLTLEAMKMENTIESAKDGVIKRINVKQGDAILQGDILVVIK
jgi:biotin carboxyl carrier protein